MNAEDILVSICCVTYNHENYIRQCLDGFVMQKTTFAFEVLVHEDASTDSTAEILREYELKFSKLFRCVYQTENQFLKQNTLVNILFKMAKGKYIALCEGDDYWTDPYKLQKQVDFLEANQDYSICWGGYSELWMSNNTMVKPSWMNQVSGSLDINFDNLFNPYCTITLTTVLRSDALDIKNLMKLKYIKDNSIYILCLTKGKGYLMESDFGVYRIHDRGVYSALSDFEKSSSSYLNIREALLKIKGSRSQNLIQIKKELLGMALATIPKKFYLTHYKFLFFGIFELGILQFLKIIKNRFINSNKNC